MTALIASITLTPTGLDSLVSYMNGNTLVERRNMSCLYTEPASLNAAAIKTKITEKVTTYFSGTYALDTLTGIIWAIPVDELLLALPYKETFSNGLGTKAIYLTDDRTASGMALFTSAAQIVPIININDPAGVYGRGWTISGDLKTLTVSATKQVPSGVTLLGVNVLTTLTLSAAPNGTEFTVIVGRK